jgi:hypothetical protein
VDRTDEGINWRLTTRRLHVLETPGHSDCSLSFTNRRKALVILMPRATTCLSGLLRPNYFFNYAVYVQSIGRLAGLQANCCASATMP